MHTSLFSVVLAASTAGCMMLNPANVPGPSQAAANPLNGHPVTATKSAFEPPGGCRVWPQLGPDAVKLPMEDAYAIEATDAQICLKLSKLLEASPTWTGEPTSNKYEGLKLTTDNAPRGVVVQATKMGASKVGMCGASSVWKVEYQGCTSNGGVLTKSTKTLSSKIASWEFADSPADTATRTTSAP